MAISTKPIDETRHDKHFKHVHVSYPNLKSALVSGAKARDFFYIDEVKVEEKTFWAAYNQPEESRLDRLGKLFTRINAVLTRHDWKSLESLSISEPESPKIRAFMKALDRDLAALEEIEAELSPEEREIFNQEKAKYVFPKGYERSRLHILIQLSSSLYSMIEQQMMSEMQAQLESLKNLGL